MKAPVIILTTFVLIFSSCKKNTEKEDTAEPDKKYDVSFKIDNVSAFVTSSQTHTSATEPLSTYITNIDYFVYQADKKLASSGSQTASGTSSFGNINMKLTAGTYTIVIFGYYYINDIKLGLYYRNQSTIDQLAISPLSNTFPDTFIKKLEFTVGPGTGIASTLTLERYTAKIEITSTDLIPSNVSYVSASLRAPTFFLVNSETPDMGNYTNSTYTGTNAGKNMTIILYPLIPNANTGLETGTITLNIYNNSNVLMGTKVIESRTIYRNQKLTLTGKLFDNLFSQSAQIGVNGDWGSTVSGTF